MSDYVCVNRIKSLKQHIEDATGETYNDLTEAVQALKDGYGVSGGSSGIIDVTELPTSNIEENAVYRLTENFQTNINEIYHVSWRGEIRTITEYIASKGIPVVPNIYVVDNLPSDMKASDVTTFTELNAYMSRSDGKVYMYVDGMGVITLGMLIFQESHRDMGSTDNVLAETKEGIYTTFEAHKQSVRYFVREDNEWEELSAVMIEELQNGFTDVDVLKGAYRSDVFVTKSKTVDVKSLAKNEKIIPSKVVVDIPLMGDIIDFFTDIEEITVNDFYKTNGEAVHNLRYYAFAGMRMKKIDIPDFFIHIPDGCFYGCTFLEAVTIPESVEVLYPHCFDSCNTLTDIVIPAKVNSIQTSAFRNCYSLTTVSFKGKPNTISSDIFSGTSVETINVPWSEGEVGGAPWGASNATINYNYTEG